MVWLFPAYCKYRVDKAIFLHSYEGFFQPQLFGESLKSSKEKKKIERKHKGKQTHFFIYLH